MNGRYILDENNNAVEEPDLLKWAKWFESAGRRVLRQDRIDGVKVSTVFLGLDHSWGDGPPLLWETMIFGGKHDSWQDRYSTAEDALLGHLAAIEMVKNSLQSQRTEGKL